MTVESLFQSGKVFEKAGPFPDFYHRSGREIKRDRRLRNSGDLLRFELAGEHWPLEPKTFFYDWIYLNALQQNQELSSRLIDYDGFSDIAFNPSRSFSCQARSAAMFVALSRRGLLSTALRGQEEFMRVLSPKVKAIQCSLF